jgi:hypothetical protein
MKVGQSLLQQARRFHLLALLKRFLRRQIDLFVRV